MVNPAKLVTSFGKYSILHWLCLPFFFPFSKDHRSFLWSLERSFCFSEEKNMSRLVEFVHSEQQPSTSAVSSLSEDAPTTF